MTVGMQISRNGDRGRQNDAAGRTARKAKVAGDRGGPATRSLQLRRKFERIARACKPDRQDHRDRESRRLRRNRRGAFNIFTSGPRAADHHRNNARSLALEVGVIASRRRRKKKKRINETDRSVTSPRFTCLPTVAPTTKFTPSETWHRIDVRVRSSNVNVLYLKFHLSPETFL